MGERAYIDPREAEKFRSSDHTPEEKKERHERAKGLIREMESKPQSPQEKELHERRMQEEKPLTKDEREERDRESI